MDGDLDRFDGVKVGEARTTTAIARAALWLDKRDPAIEGEGGDDWTFKTAATLVRDFDLSAEAVTDLMLGAWNQRCAPPWEAKALKKKVDNAARYARGPAGAKLAEGRRRSAVTPTGRVLEAIDGEAQPDPRPTLVVGVDVSRVVDESIALLEGDDQVYQRSGLIVHLRREGASRYRRLQPTSPTSRRWACIASASPSSAARRSSSARRTGA